MFRLTHYIEELVSPSHPKLRKAKGPVVIWNLLRKCNLSCRHCYANSFFKDFDGELNLDQCLKNVDSLKEASVPALILSGGEPLLHPHVFEIAQYAKTKGFYLALSSNGILITPEVALKLKEIDFNYVGVSLDGIGEVHDHIRGEVGAFDKSLQGIKNGVAQGLKMGLRTTLTHTNFHQVEQMIDLSVDLGVKKFYLSHLNYGGRGNKKEDAHFQMTRKVMNMLFEKALDFHKRGIDFEIVTGNNDADAAFMLLWAKNYFSNEKIQYVKGLLEHWGGNSSGVGVANIDSQGEVHPDTFWPGEKVGSIKERPFHEIWLESNNEMLKFLRSDRSQIHGKCKSCDHFSYCHGNTRVRAVSLLNDPFASDPGCYLEDHELFLTVKNTNQDLEIQNL